MASNETENVVLISIHPEFADAILCGKKRVEFRKTRIARPFKTIVLYATSPVCGVVGLCYVEEVQEAPPLTLWNRHHKVGGIDRAQFMQYFNGTHQGIALVLSKVVPLDAPLPLSRVSPNLRPPQSFVYLSQCGLANVLARQC